MSLKWLLYGAVVASAGCASGRSAGPVDDPFRSYDPDRVDAPGGADFVTLYRQMGLAASPPPLSFVANAGFFATPAQDTSIVVVALSFPNRGLTFTHSDAGYSASYVVEASLSLDGVPLRQARDSEAVKVVSFKETSRTDESVIFRREFRAPPGDYQLLTRVLDVAGSRSAEQTLRLTVPRFGRPSLSTPVVVYEATPRGSLDGAPNLLPAPRASFVFGVDDSAMVYLESYGGGSAVHLQLRNALDSTVWRDSVRLPDRGRGTLSAGVVEVPLQHADIGVLTLLASRDGSPDSTRAPLFQGFGPDLPVVSFDQMLSYLRFFAPPNDLRKLREARPDQRGELWSRFLRSTDPIRSTSRNEALDDYFVRIRDANESFSTDIGRGWLSDRGMVYVGLGEPFSAYTEFGYMNMTGDIGAPPDNKVKLLIWEYPDLRVSILFYDPMNTDQWRLAPRSRPIFLSYLSRQLLH